MDNKRENEEGKAYCPFSQVFSNDLLREIILEKAIHEVGNKKMDSECHENQHPHYSIKEISRFRLVSKSSLDTISKLLRKRNAELKRLHWLSGNYSRDYTIEIALRDKKSLLEKVVALFSSPDHLDQLSVIPFALSFDRQFFAMENHQILADCLTRLSSSLTTLKLELPAIVQIPSLNANSDFNFPCLKTLVIRWILGAEQERTQLDENSTEDSIFFMIQKILDGTEKLTRFDLNYLAFGSPSARCLNFIPERLKNLRLPRTITELNLLGKHLELLIRQDLPKLNELTVDLCWDVSPNRIDQISGILEKYKEALISFELCDEGERAKKPANDMFVKLPLMEKLKTLIARTTHCSFMPSLRGFEKCMPNLDDLKVYHMPVATWLKFLGHSNKFQTVESLDLEVLSSGDDNMAPGDYVNLNENQMTFTCAAFSNLQSLTISINPLEMRILFREFRHLEQLSVNDYDGISDAYEWTEVLLGITSDECRRLEPLYRQSRHKGAEIEVNREKNAVSILNLTELTYFGFTNQDLFRNLDSLAYMIFYLGFMKMTSLADLSLECYFKTTPKMIQEFTDKRKGYTYMDSYDNFSYDDTSGSDEEGTVGSDDNDENELGSGGEDDNS